MSNIGKLSSSSSLKDLVDRQELLTNNIEEQKNTLKEILISKNIEVADSENKLSILIQKVEELKEDDSIAWLFKDGNEKVSFEVLGNGITINKFNFVGSGACSSKKVSALRTFASSIRHICPKRLFANLYTIGRPKKYAI